MVLGESSSFQVALDCSAKVKGDLVQPGFVHNSEKSLWVPTPVIDWLGFTMIYFRVCFSFQGRKSSGFCPTLI